MMNVQSQVRLALNLSFAAFVLLLWKSLPLGRAFTTTKIATTPFAVDYKDQRTTSSLYSSVASPEIERAKLVFDQIDEDDSGNICAEEIKSLLVKLDLDASDEEANALFRYLDVNGSGAISLEEFLPWYQEAVSAAKEVASSFQALLIGRRTVDYFDPMPISDDVLKRAIACAIAAPNRSRSEPWRFISLGPDTIAKVAELNQQMSQMSMAMETDIDCDPEDGCIQPLTDWTQIPGWCVVTTTVTPGENEVELEDFKSTSCAVQNFMLSMWSEGIGSKWTSGPVQKTKEFAELCGVDTTIERVAGCIWYGFATGGLVNADPKRRQNTVDDVLTSLP